MECHQRLLEQKRHCLHFQSRTCSESHLRSFSINVSVVMEEAVNPRLYSVHWRHFFPCGETAGRGTLSSFVWGNFLLYVLNEYRSFEKDVAALSGLPLLITVLWMNYTMFFSSRHVKHFNAPVSCIQITAVTVIRLWSNSRHMWSALICYSRRTVPLFWHSHCMSFFGAPSHLMSDS